MGDSRGRKTNPNLGAQLPAERTQHCPISTLDLPTKMPTKSVATDSIYLSMPILEISASHLAILSFVEEDKKWLVIATQPVYTWSINRSQGRCLVFPSPTARQLQSPRLMAEVYKTSLKSATLWMTEISRVRTQKVKGKLWRLKTSQIKLIVPWTLLPLP